MEAIKCSRGHYYDKALGSCPVCAAEAGNQRSPFVTGSDVPDDIPATTPAGGFDIPATIPASQPAFTPTDLGMPPRTNAGPTPPPAAPKWDLEDYGATTPADMFGGESFDPVVGWLICTKGPNRGKDYRLHSGTNFIGRGKQSDVCIEGDSAVSTKNHASVTYDEREKVFFITKGEVRNPTYLNGRALRSDADLNVYDRIEIGGTELIFVPLCGESFNWNNI